MTARTSRGFTLLEVMIAMAIFGLVAAMAYGGLTTVLNARERTDKEAQRLAHLDSAMLFLGRDLAQAARRSVRDELGDTLPAMQGGVGAERALEFTRAGWSNPAGRPRSDLQRVAWGLNDETLVRTSWWVLDRTPSSEPYDAKLLDHVTDLKVRFLDVNRQWQETWPPANITDPDLLPLAVEVTLELSDWGTVTRLVEVPGG